MARKYSAKLATNPVSRLLCDTDSLRDYREGRCPTALDVKRRLKLAVRRDAVEVPDHYYTLAFEEILGQFDSLPQLLYGGLGALASSYLEIREKRIYVKASQMNQWQRLLTYSPPLILLAAFIHKERWRLGIYGADGYKHHEALELLNNNARYTALPSAYIPQLQHFIRERKGLHDLHIHLNGSTEVDASWQDCLAHPDQVYRDIEKKFRNPHVREQIEQESSVFAPKDFRRSLYVARSLRAQLVDALVKWECPNGHTTWCDKMISEDNASYQSYDSSYKHPMLVFFSSCDKQTLLPLEGLMYLELFDLLEKIECDHIANGLHHYLLILGELNRLLVQQVHQNGFVQFQKITLNDLRDVSEKRVYANRFRQMYGNDLCHIRLVEGRFAPKETKEENVKILENIDRGWQELLDTIRQDGITDEPELTMVAHFIKQMCNSNILDRPRNGNQYRFKGLRKQLSDRARGLADFIQDDSLAQMSRRLVGIDAASSEFDTPPEVFAPIFRFLKSSGAINRATYHAGEDFYHLLGGMRAIYEAIHFCELSSGDRIGHGTAVGLSPDEWLDNIGQWIYLRQGDYLDDLVFAYDLIANRSGDESLLTILPRLSIRISELCSTIYQRNYTIPQLIRSWELRKYHPNDLLQDDEDEARKNCLIGNEFYLARAHRHGSVSEQPELSALSDYHDFDCRKRYNKIIKVDTTEIFSSEALLSLQNTLLKLMCEQEIVIEALPTSNIRIGHYQGFETYHIKRWVTAALNGEAVPPIVLGSDDPGIFATSICNEYGNIYCSLVYSPDGCSHNRAMEIIEYLDRNSQIYRFPISRS